MIVTIHVNPAQPHQLEHAQWFKHGLERHGIALWITENIGAESDIHIVSGNHYAKDHWIGHPRTIWLDKRLYQEGPKPDHMKSDPYVSLGWLRNDGGRTFRAGCGRKSPAIKANGAKNGTIFLADYDGPIERADRVRQHPARERSRISLIDELSKYKIAIGYQTSALVTAALEGLEIICKDKRNIMSESNWLDLLPYADWHWSEIESGEAWEHLCQQY